MPHRAGGLGQRHGRLVGDHQHLQQDDQRRGREQRDRLGDEQHQRDEEDRQHPLADVVEVGHVDQQRHPEQGECHEQPDRVEAGELQTFQ